MPENLNLNLESHMLERANFCKLFSDFHMHLYTYIKHINVKYLNYFAMLCFKCVHSKIQSLKPNGQWD